MESRLPKPSGLKKPMAFVPKDRLATASSQSIPSARIPLNRDLLNIQLPSQPITKRRASPDLRSNFFFLLNKIQ